jgi:hypothetical protein
MKRGKVYGTECPREERMKATEKGNETCPCPCNCSRRDPKNPKSCENMYLVNRGCRAMHERKEVVGGETRELTVKACEWCREMNIH